MIETPEQRQEFYFHLCGQRLGPSSIIKAGNWGRVVKAVGWEHQAALRETVLEQSRLLVMSEAPSRYTSAYCFQSIAQLNHYRQINLAFKFHVAHRVRLADPDGITFRTYSNWVTPNNLGELWPSIYWTGVTTENDPEPLMSEILTTSDLVVVECLE